MSQPKCKAISRSTGKQCGNLASIGTTVCYMHGAKAPKVANAAKRRVAAEKAEQQVKRYLRDQPVLPIDDPIRALQEMTAEAKAFYSYVRTIVANLDPDEWPADHGSLNAYVALLERSMAQVQRFLTDWVRLGLEERLVRLSERQAEAIGRVIDGVLTALDLPAEYHAKAQAELPRQLRLVSRAS